MTTCVIDLSIMNMLDEPDMESSSFNSIIEKVLAGNTVRFDNGYKLTFETVLKEAVKRMSKFEEYLQDNQDGVVSHFKYVLDEVATDLLSDMYDGSTPSYEVPR